MPTMDRITDKLHKHELILKESLVPFKCDGCVEVGFGWCYQCPVKNCNFILHQQCGFLSPPRRIPFFDKCNFQFHRENPLGGTRICDACASNIEGFLYQCRSKDKDLHPCCTYLPLTINSLEPINGIGIKLHLHKKVKSKCLICRHEKRRSGKIQGWGYVSLDGTFSCHIACMKEYWFECWKNHYLQVDQAAIDVEKWNSLIVQHQAPNEIVRRKKSKAKKTSEWVKIVVKLLFSAIFGDPLGLISIFIQISHNI